MSLFQNRTKQFNKSLYFVSEVSIILGIEKPISENTCLGLSLMLFYYNALNVM